MRPPIRPLRGALLAVALLAAASILLSGCWWVRFDEPQTTTVGAVEATGTVQASMPIQTTDTATLATAAPAPAQQSFVVTEPKAPSTAKTITLGEAPSDKATNPYSKPLPMSASHDWPQRMAQFGVNFKGPVWYPASLPKGYKVLSCDVVEMDAGSGLVCDTVFTNGSSGVTLTQGSPKSRSYEVVSVGKVAWGTETADVVHQDPGDKSTPKMIVYNKGGNFAELSADALTFEQLKTLAAGLVVVR